MTKIEINKPHPYVFPVPKVDHPTKLSPLAQYPKDIDEKRTEMLEENLAENPAEIAKTVPKEPRHLDQLV